MDPRKPEESTAFENTAQAEKPLGRGLEQISHLFLTQRLGDGRPVASTAARAPDPPRMPSAARVEPRPILLRPNTSVTRSRFVAILREFLGSLEEGLRVIDVFLPCYPYGEIDLLALDRSNHLTLIDFDTVLNDSLVIRGLAHCEWLVQNLPNVRRMHSGQVLQLTGPPRLFLLAPGFSALMTNAARQLMQPRIHRVRYQLFDTGSTIGVSFETAE
jgi:hypothetical protein